MRNWALTGIMLLGASTGFAAPNLTPFSPADVRAANDVTDIDLKHRENRWEVVVKTSRPVPFSGRKMTDGRRYFVDFPDCRLMTGEPVLSIQKEGFTVRAAQFSVDPAIVRVVIQTEGISQAALSTLAPSERAVITLPMKKRTLARTVMEFSRLPESVQLSSTRPKPKLAQRRSRTRLASRRGRVSRPAPTEMFFQPDALEAFDDPPVPSTGGSINPVFEADLPDPLKTGTRIALSGNRRYVWGGETPDGFDCSGMMQFIYRHANVQIPRTAADQYKNGVPVETSELQPGDLVFFSNGKRIFHVGMYIGNGMMLHAANSKRGITTDMLSSTFYSKHYAGARRLM